MFLRKNIEVRRENVQGFRDRPAVRYDKGAQMFKGVLIDSVDRSRLTAHAKRSFLTNALNDLMSSQAF